MAPEVGALAVVVASPLFRSDVAKKRIYAFFLEDLFLTVPHSHGLNPTVRLSKPCSACQHETALTTTFRY